MKSPPSLPCNPSLPAPNSSTNTHTRRACTVGAWARWFPYAAFRDALSRTWATWGSLGTGKSHSNSGLKICLPPSQHGLNINSFMSAICKGARPSRQAPSLCPSDLSDFIRISNRFVTKHRNLLFRLTWAGPSASAWTQTPDSEFERQSEKFNSFLQILPIPFTF